MITQFETAYGLIVRLSFWAHNITDDNYDLYSRCFALTYAELMNIPKQTRNKAIYAYIEDMKHVY